MTSTDTDLYPSAESLLSSIKRTQRAIADLNKARRTWAKYKKAEKAGTVTDEQVAAARAVLRESAANSLAVIMEAALYAAGDECDIDLRSERNAAEIIS